VLRQPSVAQVVVVDDASTDGSFDIAQRFRSDARVQVIRHDRNRGKGAPRQTALAAVTSPLVVVQDADLEYDPEYGRLISPIIEGRADVVYGVRGFASHTACSYWFVQGEPPGDHRHEHPLQLLHPGYGDGLQGHAHRLDAAAAADR
jgi:glycosyltransferase involved in cell wall biosynthesis